MTPLSIRRSRLVLYPDRTRVLLRPFLPTNDLRARRICADVLRVSERRARALWARIQADFGPRHARIEAFLQRRCDQIHPVPLGDRPISRERRLLLGAYFSHEYALEAAALFNPSIVPHPDQAGLARGVMRFILSLRATGEGHISSITFRTGTLDKQGRIRVMPPRPYCIEPDQVPSASYQRALFGRKLQELGIEDGFSRRTLHRLPDVFTLDELRASVRRAARELRARRQETADAAVKIVLLAQSNYEVQFDPATQPCERVLFPTSPSQSNGIEDARFVRFHHDNGTSTYYATYTAYDGRMILPQLIETPDFLRFKFITLNGQAVRNKGLALFPRKIHGQYAMLGRQDRESIFVMFSDHLHFWHSAQRILRPKFPWEFIQLGNCGSPIETEAGWLVLSHGVGAMRRYCIGAFLLDRDNPGKVIARLREPLIQPAQGERDGYVPNVVYSCGSLLHGRRLVIPYAMSDSATTFATLQLDDLLDAMD